MSDRPRESAAESDFQQVGGSQGDDVGSWENISDGQHMNNSDKVESISDALSEEPSPMQSDRVADGSASQESHDTHVRYPAAKDRATSSDMEETLRPSLDEQSVALLEPAETAGSQARPKAASLMSEDELVAAVNKELHGSPGKVGEASADIAQTPAVESLPMPVEVVVSSSDEESSASKAAESGSDDQVSDQSSSDDEQGSVISPAKVLPPKPTTRNQSISSSGEEDDSEAPIAVQQKKENLKSESSSSDDEDSSEEEPSIPAKKVKSSSSEEEEESSDEEEEPVQNSINKVVSSSKTEMGQKQTSSSSSSSDDSANESSSSSEEQGAIKSGNKNSKSESEEESSEDDDEEETGEEEDERLPTPPKLKVAAPLVRRAQEPSQTQAHEQQVHQRSKSKGSAMVKGRRASSSSHNSSSPSGSGSDEEEDDIERGARRRRDSEESEESDSDDSAESSDGSDSDSSSGSASKSAAKQGLFARARGGCGRVWKGSRKSCTSRVGPLVSRMNKVLANSPVGPQFAKVKLLCGHATFAIKDDFGEIRRLRRSLSAKPRSEWNLRQLPSRTKLAVGRITCLLIISLMALAALSSSGAGLSWLPGGGKRVPKQDFPPNWKRTRQLSFPEIMDLINVYDNSVRNDTTVKIKKLPQLDKPIYLTMTSKDLVQIKRPAVRKKRPDEPRAVRTFGCLRDGCRGLEIEDLLDRGWQMRFRAAQKNDTYKSINYRVTFLLTDTTQLNHMRAVRPDLYESIYNTYEGKSYLIAFDGADAIGGNKGQQLKVKEKFVRKYGCKFSELAISPASYRLYLEDECQDLVSFGSSQATWLLKPETGSQGQGITFHTEITDIMNKQPKFFPCAEREWKATERYLVQEYIEHPLLLKKCKFDARVYMNVASSSPWLVYYHEGYLRRALAPYTPLSRDRRVYLTNTHFQSMKKDFKLSEHIWSFPEFQAYLKEQGRTGAHYIESMLNPYIKKVALFIFQSARQKMKKRKGTFHIMGLDFMIDDDFHVWFIEANGFPGFTWSINFDTRTMVEEWFNLAQQVHENPRFYMLQREGDRYGGFEMIFSELEEERMQYIYNPCQEFKYSRGYSAPLKEANRLFAQISGKGGKTERFKRYISSVKGAQLLGGSRHEQLQARESYLKKHGCRLNAVHFTPPTYMLYDQEQCNNFFTEYATSNAAWVLKPVVSPGNAEELRVFANQAAMKSEFGDCSNTRQPDFVVQQLLPERPLVNWKWWDIRVYMLIANTKPWMVFYHHGFARTAKLSYVPGGEAETVEGSVPEQEGDDKTAGSGASGGEKEEEDDAVELDDEEGGDEDDGKAEKGGENGELNAQGDAAAQAAAAAAAAGGTVDPNSPLLNQPPAEPWAPSKITTGATWTLGEEFMTLEAMEDEMARTDMVGSRWLSSVFDVYAKRVAHLLFQSARPSLERGNETYQITALNFMLDHKLQIHFIGARNVDADSIPNVDVLQEHKANFLETLAGLVLELHTLPAAFARMRRGDSYGQWRLVFSEMEEKQRSMTYDPCDEFKRNLQVSKSSLFKDAWLHQHELKSHARNKRELRKYIDRKWESSCKGKPTAELRASCIRNTISYRYKKYIEKERVPYQEGYVENYIRELEHRPKTSGSGASQGGGL